MVKKRVLIITYYWPPSGGSGVQRWLKFAKYLPEFNWDPVIVTPENPDFDIQDPSLEQEVSPAWEVIKVPIWEPYGLLNGLRGKSKIHAARLLEQKKRSFLERIAIWLRANVLVPDPRIFWVKPAVKALLRRVEAGEFQAIITTGPPHSIHLIGKALKEKTGVTWVADFRDPWSEWEFLDTLPMLERVRKKHHDLERSVLKQADRILTISPTFREDLQRLAGKKVDLMTNGFDPEDLPGIFPGSDASPNEFHWVYTGVIDSIRNPLPFLEVFRDEFFESTQKVRLTFVGKVSEQVKQYIQEDSWLSAYVDFAGYVSHQEVFSYYAQADALLLILTATKNAKGNIPGKLFEYLATGLPVLALGDPEGDSASILRKSQAGLVISPDEPMQLQQVIRQWSQGEKPSGSKDSHLVFSRKTLSENLAKLLDEELAD